MRDLRQDLPNRCHPPGPEDEKGLHQIPGGLPDMSLVQDVLSCGCHHHFTGKVDSGRSFMGVNHACGDYKQFFQTDNAGFCWHAVADLGHGSSPGAYRVEGSHLRYNDSRIFPDDRAAFLGADKQICGSRPKDEQRYKIS